MRHWLDTEFIERGPDYPIDLISIGIVAQDGREYYALNYDCNHSKASDWVKKNVLSQIPPMPLPQIYSSPKQYQESEAGRQGWRNKATISLEINLFVGTDSKPEFWADYADYDWVVFCQIFGTMMDLPAGFPMYCNDIQQWRRNLGSPELPRQTGTAHNALDDARYCKQLWEFLNTYSKRHHTIAPSN